MTTEPLDEPRRETVPRSAAAPAELAALDGVRSATQEPTIDDLLSQQARSSGEPPARRARGAETGPRLKDVTLAEAWWQVGREPGRQWCPSASRSPSPR